METKLHKFLNDKRMNLVHSRREFFNINIDEIEQVMKELNLDVQLTKIAEAKEFRMSQSIRETKKSVSAAEPDNKIQEKLEKFPANLT